MNKSQILENAKKNELKTEQIFVSDFGAEITVKQLSGKQYVEISEKCIVGKHIDNKKFLNYAIIASVFDDEGVQVFDDGDIELILNLSADGYSALIVAITRLNNLEGGEFKNQKNLKKAN